MAGKTASRGALKDGDVIRFDYTLWEDGGDKPLETSREEVAQQHNIVREGKRYRPVTVTLGAGQVIPGLEAHMRSHAEVGKEAEVDLEPPQAYGERDPKKVVDVPMARFRTQKVQPEVGMELNLQGARGVVVRVAGGRVRVDTNHELAGRKLRYQYVVREVVGDEKGKVQAVLDALFGPGAASAEVSADAVTVQVPDAVKFDRNWMLTKFRVVSDLRAVTGKSKAVRLVETYPVMPEDPEAGEEEAHGDEPGHEGHGHGPGGHRQSHGDEE